MSVVPVYVGFDPREEAGTHVFVSSVLHRASRPVSFIPLHLPLFRSFYSAGHRDGTNAFIFTRYLIPYLQGFDGWAIFADGADMICRADITELWALRDPSKAVMVVPHDYKTKHPRKYIGTKMESANVDYPLKNRTSLMLINCGHFAWRHMKPEVVEMMSAGELHQLQFIPTDQIGYLPMEWNHLVGEQRPNPNAKIVHFTLGTPAFPHYADCEFADAWRSEFARAKYVTA
jgi:lipopolysaccharide biosynthesis glycosyltransferase